MNNHNTLNRRSFIRQITLTGLSVPFLARGMMAASPNSKLNHASFGGGGMAASDLGTITHHDFVNFVALAEVDLNRAKEWKERFPNLKVYQDWREMLDKEKNLDCVNVSTPDHMHAPMGISAMQRGLHLYGQKPLAHDIYEVRRMTEFARQKKVATQMGIQIHSDSVYRLAVKLVQDLAIGKIKEVHTWSEKKWGDSSPKPDRIDPVPDGFNWDLWLGVTAERPFIGNGYYHPGNWRKRLDFGTGTFGDMGCHIYDPVFKALDLTAPISVRSEGDVPNQWNWASNAIIKYIFPGTKFTDGATVAVTWYDGDQRPGKEIRDEIEKNLGKDENGKQRRMPGQGSYFIGTKGTMLLPHIGRPQLFPEAQFAEFKMPKVQGVNHWTQWLNACRGEGTPSANFDYAGPLTEAVLLGGVATRFPKTTLEWNAAKLEFSLKEANALLRRPYRKGWEVPGLS